MPAMAAAFVCAVLTARTTVVKKAGVGMRFLPPPYSGQIRVKKSYRWAASKPWICSSMFVAPPGKSRLIIIMA